MRQVQDLELPRSRMATAARYLDGGGEIQAQLRDHVAQLAAPFPSPQSRTRHARVLFPPAVNGLLGDAMGPGHRSDTRPRLDFLQHLTALFYWVAFSLALARLLRSRREPNALRR